jgi:hypothetical protein
MEAKTKRNPCFRENELKSRKPKTKKQGIELSVDRCIYQYCHEPFFGGGHILYFGYSSDTIRPPPSINSRIRVMTKRENSIVV